MIDFEKQYEHPESIAVEKTTALSRTFKIVYGWMAVGLAISGLVAWYTATSGFVATVAQHLMAFVVAELALVFVLSLAINKLPVAICYLLFLGYAALNGLTLSMVFLIYKLASVQLVFFITAGMFGGFAVYGAFTKSNLSSVGSVCGMALWGLIIAGVVNLFTHSSGLDLICSFFGVLIFSGLTMFDAQKIRQLAAVEGSMDSVTIHKVGIIGALQLYLDFINLFLYLLRFFGRRDD